MRPIAAASLVDGDARGRIIAWSTPLSFWGGFDAANGRVVDRSHPACGDRVSGAILAMPSGRGSSSSSSVLAESIRRGTAPAAIILATPDPIIAVGSIVALRLYGKCCPVLVCAQPDFGRLATGRHARVMAHDGRAEIMFSGDKAPD